MGLLRQILFAWTTILHHQICSVAWGVGILKKLTVTSIH